MGYRTDTRALVMAALAAGPQHGYGIAKVVQARSGNSLKLGEGQIYPILRELEQEGFVSGEWENENTDQPRKRYSLTAGGRTELDRRKELWEEYVSSVKAVLSPIVVTEMAR